MPPADQISESSPATADKFAGRRSWGRAFRVVMLIAAVSGLATCLVYPFPLQGRMWAALFDLAHAPAFFLVFLGIAGISDPTAIGLGGRWKSLVPLSVRKLILLSIFLCVIGGAGELLQGLVGRSPSWMDVVANCVGVLAAMFWCVSRRLRQNHFRWMLASISPALLIGVSVPPLQSVQECVLQNREFPLLASFERSQELTAWYPHQATAMFVTEWSSHGTQSMRIEGKRKRRFPGATMTWPINDWTGYAQLQMDVFNPQETELTVGINIGDRNHAETGHDPSNRFEKRFMVPASSMRTITIPLEEVASSPATRQMVMTEIAMLDVYLPEADEPTIMYVDNIRLTN